MTTKHYICKTELATAAEVQQGNPVYVMNCPQCGHHCAFQSPLFGAPLINMCEGCKWRIVVSAKFDPADSFDASFGYDFIEMILYGRVVTPGVIFVYNEGQTDFMTVDEVLEVEREEALSDFEIVNL